MNALDTGWKGEVTFILLDRKKGTFTYITDHNDIQPEAKEIALKRLVGLGNPLNRIEVSYNSSSIWKTPHLIQYPSPRRVSFFALLGESEAVGTINALALKDSSIGNFSWFNTLEVIKPNTLELLIRWTLTMDSCQGLPPEPLAGQGFIYQDGSGILLQDGSGFKLNLPD